MLLESDLCLQNGFLPNTKDNPPEPPPEGDRVGHTSVPVAHLSSAVDNSLVNTVGTPVDSSHSNGTKNDECEILLKDYMKKHPKVREEIELTKLLSTVFEPLKNETIDSFVKEVFMAVATCLDEYSREERLYNNRSTEEMQFPRFQKPFNRTTTTARYFLCIHLNTYAPLFEYLRIKHTGQREWIVSFREREIYISPKKKGPDKRKAPNLGYFDKDHNPINLFKHRGPRGVMVNTLKSVQPGNHISQDKDPPGHNSSEDESVIEESSDEPSWLLE